MKRALLTLLVMVGCAGLVHAQSLADVAKKTEEQRAKKVNDQTADGAAKTDKVYTNKDLKGEPAPAIAATEAPASDTAAPSSTSGVQLVSAPAEQTESERAAEYRKVAKKDESYWKDRMRTLKAQLDADQTFVAAAMLREHALDTQLHRNLDDTLYIRDRLRRAEVEGQWQDAVTDLTRLRAVVLNDARAIATLEEEARRAGVPNGWLRP